MRETAEGYYMAGDFYCSETVLKVICENFATELPDDIVSLASAFPHGVGWFRMHLRSTGGRYDVPGYVLR